MCMARWSGWRAGVRDGMWESMGEALPLLVKCNSGMATLGVCVWVGRSLAVGEVRVVLVVAWSPRMVVEVVVGPWNVLGKLQDRVQL
jgi:hypothetical protein